MDPAEEMARALCIVEGLNPDKVIGNPPHPRWRAYLTYAAIALRANAHIAAQPQADKEGA